MKIALMGATGLVGREMISVLEAFGVKADEFIPVASAKSQGLPILYGGKSWPVISAEDALKQKPDFALFSAGGAFSTEWAPRFVEVGCTVIDNSSAWRMHENIALIVPEVNAHLIPIAPAIIANPNCSTIQLVVVLKALSQLAKLQRVIISTYQSVTGTGAKAIAQLNAEERREAPAEMVYPWPIYRNVLPQCDVFTENGFTKEEMKLVNETRKIMERPDLMVTATAVRVPVVGGHSESVNVEFDKPVEVADAKAILAKADGVVLMDNPAKKEYPMPLHAHGKNEVFVGRIRKDLSHANGLHLWIVADNLRKGAATNAVQILMHLLKR